MVEDLSTHYMKPEILKDSFWRPYGPTFMDWAANMTHLLHCRSLHREGYAPAVAAACDARTQLEKEVISIDCSMEACAVVKDAAGAL